MSNVCFNSSCKQSSENLRTAWRRRTGEFARLCDRCAAAYEEGKFCQIFHLNASGWRCCESCGKQIHCGCIVSFHMFVLLDAGGVECLTCADKSYLLTPNPAWPPPPSQFLPSQPERMKDLSVRAWSAIAGSGPVPWREAPSLFNESTFQYDCQARMPFEIDVSGGSDRFHIFERSSHEMKKESPSGRLANGKLRLGLKRKDQLLSSLNDFRPIIIKNDFSLPNLSLPRASSSKTRVDDTNLSPILSRPATVSIPVSKHVCCCNGMDSSGDVQVCNTKARGDGQGQSQLLPRYDPQITIQELQPISNDSKSCTIPLFEKMLSASDAGRGGRLVLPKKCAEAYLPPISQPEGLPLKVQDVNGKEWVFQFRFWLNNTSRMYVLEGITPCIQSMHLQAGDIVTFSRLEPDGKLVMAGRKTSTVPSLNQGDESDVTGSNTFISKEDGARSKSGEVMSINCPRKGKSSSYIRPANKTAKENPIQTWSETCNSGFISKKIIEAKPFFHSKRKNSNLGVKSKRLKFENKNLMELKLCWNEAQGLLRPPDKIVPSIFVVEGCEFEEFEEAAPVIGRPTLQGIDHFGAKAQWVECGDCFKWRKVPVDALLPARWTCSANVWDIDRSVCSAAEELTIDQLRDILPTTYTVSSKKISEHDTGLFMALEGLDTLGNTTTQGGQEGLPPETSTTKHPRHKSGCTCIVCLQPPSGKGSKHQQSCDCVVCSSLKRRFKTLMDRREKKQLEKLAESASSNLQSQQLPEERPDMAAYGDCLNVHYGKYYSASPFKGQIDLNIQPEREEELSPVFDSAPFRSPFPGVFGNLVRKEMPQDAAGALNFVSCMVVDGSNQNVYTGPPFASI